MARLGTPAEIVFLAIKMRTEGMGIRAAGRVLESHATIICWEKRLATKQKDWSAPAPASEDITVEADEVFTRYAVNLAPL